MCAIYLSLAGKYDNIVIFVCTAVNMNPFVQLYD